MSISLTHGYLPGCIGRVTQLHASYYSKKAGFGVEFESKVAREFGQFCSEFRDKRDGLWLATKDGKVEGSIAIDGSSASGEGAHLRWFILSESVHGRGVGGAMLEMALRFCDLRSYKSTYLWTFAGLEAARHLYEKSGFQLVRQSQGAQWGKLVDEQLFCRTVA